MNLQQLKYIVAINRFRNFAKAADSCNISQPTLSAMLLKLEEELDVRIFDRTNKQVTPTSAGEKIILQAKKTLLELEKITELVAEEKNQIGKSLSLSVGPSIAPYILPKFIKHYRKPLYSRDEIRRNVSCFARWRNRCWHCYFRPTS